MVLWYAPTPLDGSQAIAPLRARVNPMTSKLSGDELDDLIAIAKIDADSYEQQGDAHALRWAKNARNDEMALRELKSARESLREAADLVRRARGHLPKGYTLLEQDLDAFLSRQGMEL
jgi:hypothetical protein